MPRPLLVRCIGWNNVMVMGRGSWVNCVMGHMGHGSRKMTHFHLWRVGIAMKSSFAIWHVPEWHASNRPCESAIRDNDLTPTLSKHKASLSAAVYYNCRSLKLKLKLKLNEALDENSSLSYGTSPAISDHTVLPAIRHKWTHPSLTPAIKLVLDLPTPEVWKAELT